jgi:acetolactate synthase I/II/III large subunit
MEDDMRQAHSGTVGRREFIKQAAVVGAAGWSAPRQSDAQSGPARATPDQPPPDAAASEGSDLVEGRSGSDFMVDVIKSLGIEYVCSNTGSSFRGLQESVINYGGNEKPEFLTCCHEESSVAMAHGYFKVEGKPLAVFAHGTVGLQHAAMAIYNAYCDRVPVYMVLGNTLDASIRIGPEWLHSVQDAAAMVRDYVKWDDTPASLQHFAESAVRAYKIAMTPPGGPIVLVADTEMQERPIPEHVKLHIPRLTLPAPPAGESSAVGEIARLLVAAEHPVIVASGNATRTAEGMARLVELAELLQAAVINQPMGGLTFPSMHPLNQSQRAQAAIAEADLIVGLEVQNLFSLVHRFRDQVERTYRPVIKPDTKLVNITTADLNIKANYQNFQRYTELDIAVAADSEATLPSLVETVKRLMTGDRKAALQARGVRLAEASEAVRTQARMEAAYGWDASPITTSRMAAEIWNVIKNEDWSLVSGTGPNAPVMRLWQFDKPYQLLGGSGGGGMGYTAPASVGAALANRKYGRLSVCIQPDGDLMYAPGVLWTAAHHRIPLLSVMHNNRAYHEEVMHLQRMANRRQRGIDRAHIGTTLNDPNIDYAKLAQGLGVYAEGPIENPRDLAPALKRAVAVVKRGEPALVDVVTQPR